MVETLCSDIGFNVNGIKFSDALFYFFYNAHNRMRKGDYEDLQGRKFLDSEFEVYDNFSSKSLETFLNHPLGSQLVYFFIENYSKMYLNSLSKVFKKEVTKIIEFLKQEYNKPASRLLFQPF